MSKHNHTPAPWHDARPFGTMAPEIYTGNHPTLKRIACIIDGFEADANARLISAAPELFEELKSIVGMLKMNGYETSSADAIISKVEGTK